MRGGDDRARPVFFDDIVGRLDIRPIENEEMPSSSTKECTESAQPGRPLGQAGWLLWLLSILTHIGIVWRGAKAFRGSDQYWYVGDLVTARATGAAGSNSVYPTAWGNIGEWGPERLPPPIHNVPTVHLARLVDWVATDAYLSWVVANVALAIAASFVIRRSLIPVTGATVASGTASAFLLLPATIWFDLNPLAEQATVFAASLLVYGGLRFELDRRVGISWIAAGSILLVASRPSFILVLPVGVAFLLLFCAGWKRRVRGALLYTGVATIGVFLANLTMPSHPSRGPLAILQAGADPSRESIGNMEAYFPNENALSLSALGSKFLLNARGALLPGSAQELILESTTLVFLCCSLYLCRNIPSSRAARFWALGLFVVYLFTSIGFQAQSRYLATVVPPVFLLCAIAWKDWWGNREAVIIRRLAGTGVLVALTVLSVALAEIYRSSAVAEQADVSKLDELVVVPDGRSIVAVGLDSGSEQQLAYVVAPTPVLNVRLDGTAVCLSAEMVSAWNVSLAVAPSGTSQQEILQAFCEGDHPLRLELVSEGATTTTQSLDVWAATAS